MSEWFDSTEYINRLQEQYNELMHVIYNRAMREFSLKVKEDVEKIWVAISAAFYRDYSPKKYKRKGTLGALNGSEDTGIFHFEINGNDMSYEFDDSAMVSVRQTKDGTTSSYNYFSLVAEGGFHGGPLFSSGIPPMSPSPLDLWDEVKEKYENGIYKDRWREIYTKHLEREGIPASIVKFDY